jgi:hypothetical protein
MSSVQQIVTALLTSLGTLLPSYDQAKFQWEMTRNTGKKPVFAVRPVAGANVTGTNLAITIDQSFEVELARSWKPQAGTKDTDLDTQVLALFADGETVWRSTFLRRFNIDPGQVLLVSVVDISEPAIDNENNTVALVLTFTVKYRTNLI